MGMFDYVECEYSLPAGKGASVFQTKDTPAQMLDIYKIDADGLLWHEAYDIEDRSDPSAEGLDRFVGCMTRVNKRWERCVNFTGEITFYNFINDRTGWLEYSAYFVDGMLKELHLIEQRESA